MRPSHQRCQAKFRFIPNYLRLYSRHNTSLRCLKYLTFIKFDFTFFDFTYILFLQEDPTYLSFLEYPKFKQQKDLTLAKLEASTKTIFVHVKDYIDADWAFIEALSRAKDLVTFLKQVLNEGTFPLPPLPVPCTI